MSFLGTVLGEGERGIGLRIHTVQLLLAILLGKLIPSDVIFVFRLACEHSYINRWVVLVMYFTLSFFFYLKMHNTVYSYCTVPYM